MIHQTPLGCCGALATMDDASFGAQWSAVGHHRAHVIDLELEGGVAGAGRHRRMNCAAHAGIEQRRRPATVNDTDLSQDELEERVIAALPPEALDPPESEDPAAPTPTPTSPPTTAWVVETGHLRQVASATHKAGARITETATASTKSWLST